MGFLRTLPIEVAAVAIVGEVLAEVGYVQTRSRRRQCSQQGRFSLHLTRRRLQLKQPSRDLRWPRLPVGAFASFAPGDKGGGASRPEEPWRAVKTSFLSTEGRSWFCDGGYNWLRGRVVCMLEDEQKLVIRWLRLRLNEGMLTSEYQNDAAGFCNDEAENSGGSVANEA